MPLPIGLHFHFKRLVDPMGFEPILSCTSSMRLLPLVYGSMSSREPMDDLKHDDHQCDSKQVKQNDSQNAHDSYLLREKIWRCASTPKNPQVSNCQSISLSCKITSETSYACKCHHCTMLTSIGCDSLLSWWLLLSQQSFKKLGDHASFALAISWVTIRRLDWARLMDTSSWSLG